MSETISEIRNYPTSIQKDHSVPNGGKERTMSGKLNYRVDGNKITLYRRPSGQHAIPAGSRTADLEVAIDLDKLRSTLISDAMLNQRCSTKRVNGAIVVKPVKGSVKTEGDGTPMWLD